MPSTAPAHGPCRSPHRRPGPTLPHPGTDSEAPRFFIHRGRHPGRRATGSPPSPRAPPCAATIPSLGCRGLCCTGGASGPRLPWLPETLASLSGDAALSAPRPAWPSAPADRPFLPRHTSTPLGSRSSAGCYHRLPLTGLSDRASFRCQRFRDQHPPTLSRTPRSAAAGVAVGGRDARHRASVRPHRRCPARRRHIGLPTTIRPLTSGLGPSHPPQSHPSRASRSLAPSPSLPRRTRRLPQPFPVANPRLPPHGASDRATPGPLARAPFLRWPTPLATRVRWPLAPRDPPLRGALRCHPRPSSSGAGGWRPGARLAQRAARPAARRSREVPRFTLARCPAVVPLRAPFPTRFLRTREDAVARPAPRARCQARPLTAARRCHPIGAARALSDLGAPTHTHDRLELHPRARAGATGKRCARPHVLPPALLLATHAAGPAFSSDPGPLSRAAGTVPLLGLPWLPTASVFGARASCNLHLRCPSLLTRPLPAEGPAVGSVACYASLQ